MSVLDGILDLARPRRRVCGVEEIRALSGCRWPAGETIRVAISPAWDESTAPRAGVAIALQACFDLFARAARVDLRLVAGPDCDVVVESRPIDRPGGTLAIAEYPCDAVGRRRRREPFYVRFDREGWGQGGMPSFRVVALHELGHTLGLGHDGDPSSIMNDTLGSSKPFALGRSDVANLQVLYGPPVAAPTPPPPPPPPASPAITGTLTIDGLGTYRIAGTRS